ncbi:hypothetical protein AB0E07_21590, partial [Streptomyces sp. NPDC048002]
HPGDTPPNSASGLHPDNGSPYGGSRTPHPGDTPPNSASGLHPDNGSPYGGSRTPHPGDTSPNGASGFPHPGDTSPNGPTGFPHGGDGSPTRASGLAHPDEDTPYGGSGLPNPGGGSPQSRPGSPAARNGAADARSPYASDTRTRSGSGGPRTSADAPAPTATPPGLPWGVAVLAAGLAVEAYASTAGTRAAAMPSGLPTGPAAVLVGWALTAFGLALAGPGLTHLCGRLLQAVRPGAMRLLAGRILMQEATRIGRPLGIVCAVASAGYAMAVLNDPSAGGRDLGPLTTLGATVVTGCAVATLLTAAVEARQARADTTAALLRLGAPPTVLRGAAALRAAALLAVFGPLTLIVAELAALPLAR